nr:MAG TPA: hypothetical protein [Caudoviricetes sp.]
MVSEIRVYSKIQIMHKMYRELCQKQTTLVI